jgi:hypothetical protein
MSAAAEPIVQLQDARGQATVVTIQAIAMSVFAAVGIRWTALDLRL